MSSLKFSLDKSTLAAVRQLGANSRALDSVYERLSSGQRITRASDDAAGLSVALDLDVRSRIFTQSVRNLSDGISALTIADSALGSLSDIVIRLSELATQASNGTFSSQQRSALDDEAQALRTEYNRIVATTQFNGVSLVNGSFSNVQLQLGSSTSTIAVSAATGLLRGAGSGTFQGIVSIGSTGVQDVTLGDFNEDGKLDAFTTWNGVNLWIGNGDGTFKAAQSMGMSGERQVEAVDINQDGNLDIIAVDAAGVSLVEVRLGNGNGTFQAETSFATLNQVYRVTTADFNSDGKLDIVSQAVTDGKMEVRLGNGNGTFKVGVSTTTTNHRQVGTGDLNNDNKVDIVAGNLVFLGNGDGSFLAPTTVTFETGTGAGSSTTGRQIIDINRDGYADVVTTGDDKTKLYLGNGNGTFLAVRTLASTGGSMMWDLAVTDLNDDGHYDVVSTSYGGGYSVALGNGDGTFLSATNYSSVSGTAGISLGDITSDGVKEVVIASLSATSSIMYALGNGAQTTNLEAFSLATKDDARSALTAFTQTLSTISLERARIGASLSRVEVAQRQVTVQRDTYREARARIVDADVAQETSKLISLQILQQSAATLVAQSVKNKELVLSLLQ